MTEHQFCQILGKMRLYQALPQKIQRNIPRLLITDTQINAVAKAYISDENFGSYGSETLICGSSTISLREQTRAATLTASLTALSTQPKWHKALTPPCMAMTVIHGLSTNPTDKEDTCTDCVGVLFL